MKIRLTILLALAIFCLGLYGRAGSQDRDAGPGEPPDGAPPLLPEAPGQVVTPDAGPSPEPEEPPTDLQLAPVVGDTLLLEAPYDTLETRMDTLGLHTVPVPVDTVIVGGVPIPVIAWGPGQEGWMGETGEGWPA